MALIIVTGKNPYVGGQAIYQKSVNMQKLPADVCQISNLIADTRAEGENGSCSDARRSGRLCAAV